MQFAFSFGEEGVRFGLVWEFDDVEPRDLKGKRGERNVVNLGCRIEIGEVYQLLQLCVDRRSSASVVCGVH